MVERHDRIWALYPEYFDTGIPRRRGRRISKEHGINNPTLDELFSCAKTLGFSPVREDTVAFPSYWWRKRGRVLIRKVVTKTQAIHMIGAELIELRKRKAETEDDDTKTIRKSSHDRKKDAKGKWKDKKKRKKGHK